MSERDIEVDQDVAPEPLPKSPTAVADAVPGNFAETDVDVNEALTEAQSETFVGAADPAKPDEEPEDVVDVLRPKAAPKQWTFGPEDMPLVFIQRPLSFIQKMQWFSLVGGVLDKAMSGDNPVSVNELLTNPAAGRRGMTLEDFRDADTFVRAIGKLVVHAPKFVTDSYCIWLGVPEHQTKIVSEVMAYPAEEGGLTDDQGLEIIEVFIDQNYDALADFFGDKIGALQRRVSQRQEERQGRKTTARA
jgi:hypothetical protein